MDRYSILDQSSPIPLTPTIPKTGMTSSSQSGDESMRFPGEDGGKSLVETARGDLDAALQLLVERAKYITGALAATIALYEDGELICHACTGTPKQKPGTRLQVGSGLATESVRTRRILRSNDTSNDARTSPETCRKFGISSAMVMPLVRGPEVIGVFELLSGNTNAFEERDLSALARLGEMVETAMENAESAKQPVSTTFFDEELTEPEVAIVPLKLEPEPTGVSTAAAAQPAKASQPSEAPLLERGLIGSCKSCGFPVSGRRRLCVDCGAGQPASAGAAAETDSAPSFLEHLGQEKPVRKSKSNTRAYILGTLLIAVAAGAVVVWTRFPELPQLILQHVKLPH
jgi:putative methionine-R-sulfoxide reductase with GAF domain